LALVAVLALALAISGLLATGGGTPTATADPGGSDAADEALTQRSGDRVTVDPAALRAAQVGDTITLDLPIGPRTATVTFRDDQRGFSGWSGTLGNGWFDAVLGADGTVRINVDLPGASYAVEPGSAGSYR
ncbi:hypothetical protein, partial [Staphylococcus aureus]|uniref:hypothetical protein n=1 Tax=Staphylococcus aureus TaxID=1280 RepID=UPI00136447B8